VDLGYLELIVLGLITGSFLNALIYRLPRSISMARGRSRCTTCGETLAVRDLIPLFSYIVLGGKCRHCKEVIPWRYPFVEIVLPLLWVIGYHQLGLTLSFIYFAVITSFLLALFFTDLEQFVLPDSLTIPAIILSFAWGVYGGTSLFSLILGMIVGGAFFALQYYFSKKKWVGDGDIRFGILLGAMFGFPRVFLALWVAYLLGGIVASFLLILKVKKLDSKIPFGTFLSLAAIITLLYGHYWTLW